MENQAQNAVSKKTTQKESDLKMEETEKAKYEQYLLEKRKLLELERQKEIGRELQSQDLERSKHDSNFPSTFAWINDFHLAFERMHQTGFLKPN